MAGKRKPKASQAKGKKKRKSPNPPKVTGLSQDGQYPLSKRQTEDEWSFLNLPGEVQNAIYLAVLSNTGAILTSELRIAMPASLSRVSKQIHAQMCGQAMYCVRAEVTDFNFAKVITFLNRLSEQDVRLLKPQGKISRSDDQQYRQPRLVIHFQFDTFSGSKTRSNLARWLNRFGKANKRASNIAFEYVGACSNMFQHRLFHRRLERLDIPLETEQKRQHMRRIREGLVLSWQEKHAALASVVQQQAASCTRLVQRPMSSVPQDPCEHCVLYCQLQHRPPRRYKLGGEWAEVQDHRN